MSTFPALDGGELDEAQLGGGATEVGGGDPDWLGFDKVTEITVVKDRGDGVGVSPPPVEGAPFGKHCE